MPSKKKKYNARFPPARIKKIMQTDDEVGKVAAPVPVIISRALELFVESLVKNSSEITKARNAKTLTTSHLKACILADSQYQFLHELVANVPDVQGEEDGTPLPPMPIPEGQQTPVIVRHRSTRGRKPKNRNGESNAGPSHSTAEESESGDEDEDDDDEDEEDSDCASSENTCDNVSNLDTRPLVINHQPLPFNRVPHSITASNNNVEDDDYDS